MSGVGHVDIFTVDRISGWAWNPAKPDEPVDVVVVDESETVLTIRADQFRPDLAEAGIGNGRHGFSASALHKFVPWSRRNLTVRRAPDGAELDNVSRMLIATAGPHLLLSPGRSEWFVAFGGDAYRLADSTRASDLASYLPLSVAEPSDDVLPVAGDADFIEDQTGPGLLLQRPGPTSPQHLALGIETSELPILRWCRGGPNQESWTKSELVLEVENTIGLEFVCLLPKHATLPSKRLHVISEDGARRDFDLSRGDATTVAFRTNRGDRQRIRMMADPEPDNEQDRGFLLARLDAVWRQPSPSPALA